MSQYYIKNIEGQTYGPYSETEIRSFNLPDYILIQKEGSRHWQTKSALMIAPLSDVERITYKGAKDPYERPADDEETPKQRARKNIITIIVMLALIIFILGYAYIVLNQINNRNNQSEQDTSTILNE